MKIKVRHFRIKQGKSIFNDNKESDSSISNGKVKIESKESDESYELSQN